ncbi:inositol monophosphatase family protein [Aquibacillus albus]|uniref:inositol-phosphate phosphatase n=1 Tax=Aquibacillus albus TaxID=1168171 RepID=A0ABS2N2V2_9BACI|nr:inositol monophosphatase family protein [Aquibacillus albus]MBM7572235.1 myo-inositol-1(or 4)-monophosphatase [Aquibacillus albus]
MNEQERKRVYEQAKDWILDAGAHIRNVIDEPLYIDTKSNPNDLVTQMDRDTERFFADKINQHYPEHHLFSEEGFGEELDSLQGTVWIVDPIDGTMNFVHQKKHFAISIGIYFDGVGEIGLIYNVMEDELYHAIRGKGAYKNDKKLPQLEPELSLEKSILILNGFWACENNRINERKVQALIKKVRGTRSYGSAALEFAYVAEGIADAYLTMKLAPWDYAAGVILVEEVGGITTQANGKTLDLLSNSTILSCNQTIQEQLVNDYIELKE